MYPHYVPALDSLLAASISFIFSLCLEPASWICLLDLLSSIHALQHLQ